MFDHMYLQKAFMNLNKIIIMMILILACGWRVTVLGLSIYLSVCLSVCWYMYMSVVPQDYVVQAQLSKLALILETLQSNRKAY